MGTVQGGVKPDNATTLLSLYRTMVTIRKFETLAGEMFAVGKIPGFIHLSIGQEASAVGVCSTLRTNDYITTTHRGHGHVIAKGGDIKRMFAELMGRKTGYCKCKGGSMHIADFSLGILGANGVVAKMNNELFDHLDTPVLRLAAKDVPIPFALPPGGICPPQGGGHRQNSTPSDISMRRGETFTLF